MSKSKLNTHPLRGEGHSPREGKELSAALILTGAVVGASATSAWLISSLPGGAVATLASALIAAASIYYFVKVRERPGSSGVWLIAALLILCAAIPTYICFQTSEPAYDGWPGPLLIALASGARLSWLIASGGQRLSSLVFWVFSYVFLGLAPVVQLRAGVDPSTTPNINHAFDNATSVLVLVGMMGYYLGERWAGRNAHTQRDPNNVSALPDRRRTMLLALAGLVLAVSWALYVGPSSLLGPRDELSTLASSLWDIVFRSLATIPLLVSLMALIHLRQVPAGKWTHRIFLPIILSIALLLVVNPISGSRYGYGTAYLAILASAGAIATRARFRLFASAVLAALMLVFPLIGLLRQDGLDRGLPTSGLTTSLLSGDFDSFAQINNAIFYVNQNGITWGRQGLGVVLFWVPRTLWESKPLDTGILLAQARGYDFTNLSSPLWAELLVNGGWLFVLGGMFFLAFKLTKLDLRGIRNLRMHRNGGVLYSILPFYMLIVLRGSLLQAMATLASILACAAFVRLGWTGAESRHSRG